MGRRRHAGQSPRRVRTILCNRDATVATVVTLALVVKVGKFIGDSRLQPDGEVLREDSSRVEMQR